MKKLKIESETHGTHYIKLDDDDYDRVMATGKWGIYSSSRHNTFYVGTHTPTDKNGKRKTLRLHRFIMKEELENAPKGMVVDHINGDGLDNRRENLRVCAQAENARNRNVPPKGKVPYYGVGITPKSKTKRYWVSICADKKHVHVGCYYTAEEAAVAYDKKAKELHGEFATLNFPDGPPPDVIQKIVEGQEEYQKIKKSRSQAPKQSKQKGVYWNKQSQRWQPVIYINGKHKHLGSFKTEQEAIDGRLAAEQGIFPKRKKRTGKQSSQAGVFWDKRTQKWVARISINGKNKHLGMFKTEQKAIDARLAAEISKHKQT